MSHMYPFLSINISTQQTPVWTNSKYWGRGAMKLNQLQTQQMQTEQWLNKYGITNYKINPDGTVDVKGDVDLSNKRLIAIGVQFNHIRGCFYCCSNQLTSLAGAPQQVGGDFYCYGNQLTSLEGAPQNVGGDFNCYGNQLTSLKGAPQRINGDFYCYRNQLTSLKGAPQRINGDFYCYRNQLTSLKGAPQQVGGDFYCYGNPNRLPLLSLFLDTSITSIAYDRGPVDKIVNKHLKHGRDVFLCQDDLIDAGFDIEAQL